jgi:hypothetical protein
MSAASTGFDVGDLARDRQAHDEIGHIETVRTDGHINVRWRSGRTEWLDTDETELAPSFKR